MADSFVQGSFAFTCSIEEAALIEEAWQHAAHLSDCFAPGAVSRAFLAIFPARTVDDPLSGFTSIFDDALFPDFGADLQLQHMADSLDGCTANIFSTTDFRPGPIGTLIQRCCQQSLSDRPIGFEWSFSCFRPCIDRFGGGWCVVFADEILHASTREGLSRALEARKSMMTSDPWRDDPEYPVAHWQAQVANPDTRLGYLLWVEVQRLLVGDIETPPSNA